MRGLSGGINMKWGLTVLLSTVGLCSLQLGVVPIANAQEAPSLSAAQCVALTGMTIPAAQIMLLTLGARITKASVVAADPKGQSHPEYCLVVGEIASIDRSAPNIEFNLGLPATWNTKTFMLGGGGFDGFIPDVTGTPLNAGGAQLR